MVGTHHWRQLLTIADVLPADQCARLIAEAEKIGFEQQTLRIADWRHEGCPVTQGVKYVLRTDVLYQLRITGNSKG